MKKLQSLRRGLRKRVLCALLASVAAGCAAAPPLDDATLITVERASPADVARFESAWALRHREQFGSASFSDGKGNIIASFSPSEYDEYLAYVSAHHPEMMPTSTSSSWQWPKLRLVFRTNLVLFEPDRLPAHPMFYLCGSGADSGRLHGFSPDVMWRDQLITSTRAMEIKRLLAADISSQEYEIIFSYVFGQRAGRKAGAVELLPLPDDLCLALETPGLLLAPPGVGWSMRIDKDLVNAAVAPLPRPETAEAEPMTRQE